MRYLAFIALLIIAPWLAVIGVVGAIVAGWPFPLLLLIAAGLGGAAWEHLDSDA